MLYKMPTAVPILCGLQRLIRIRNLIFKSCRYQARRPFPFPLLLFHSFPLILPFPSLLLPFPLPSEVGPLSTAKGSGERCKLPDGVWGGAPAKIEFGAVLPENLTSGGTKFTFLCGSFHICGNWCIVLNFIATVG